MLTKFDLAETYEGQTNHEACYFIHTCFAHISFLALYAFTTRAAWPHPLLRAVPTEQEVGKDFNVEQAGEGKPRAFRCYLDVGLARTSTGAKARPARPSTLHRARAARAALHRRTRPPAQWPPPHSQVFGALKGALDGGLDIPHNMKRFAGYDKDDKKLDVETHAQYIMGGIIGEYAQELMEEEPEKYQRQFKSYVEEEIDPEDLEDLYKEVHEAIRADPAHTKKERKKPAEAKKWKTPKLTYEERKANLKEKLNALKNGGGDDEDDD